MTDRTVRARITGRVQGVSFRAWTMQEATRLGLIGWVRNCPDGSVELLARGAAEAVDRLIERCREGPPDASVDAVEARDEQGRDDAAGLLPRRFEIHR